MQRVIAVARYTIAELLHRKVIWFVLALFICVNITGYLLGQLTVGDPLKIFMDFAFLAYQLFIFGFALFFVVPFYSGAQRMRLFSLFLVKPIARWQFLIGTFLGHATVLLCAAVFFFSASVMLLYYFSDHLLWHLAPAFVTLCIESLFLSAAALLCALALSSAIAYFVLLTIYILSYTSHHWSVMLYAKGGLAGLIGSAIYYLFPDLWFLDIKSAVIYQLPYSMIAVLAASGYTLIFVLLLLLGSILIFERRAFT